MLKDVHILYMALIVRVFHFLWVYVYGLCLTETTFTVLFTIKCHCFLMNSMFPNYLLFIGLSPYSRHCMANYQYFQIDAYEYNIQVESLRTGALTVFQT